MGFESFDISAEPESENNLEDSLDNNIEAGERLKESELVLPEDDINTAKTLLSENGINFDVRQYTEGQVINKDSWVPAEFILNIKNNNGEDESFENVKEIFELLRQNGVVVRYGFNPEVAENKDDSDPSVSL